MPTALENEAAKIAKTREQQEQKLAEMAASGKADPADVEDIREEINTLTERLIDVYDRIEKNAPTVKTPTPTGPQGGPDGSIWENINGVWIEQVPGKRPNADDEITKSIARGDREKVRDERERNELAGKGWATDAELREKDAEIQKLGLNADEAKLVREKWSKEKEISDRREARADLEEERNERKNVADVARTGAETSRIGAETDLTRQSIEQKEKELPGIIENRAAQTDLAKAQAARQGRSDITSTEGAFITSVNDQGIQQTENKNFQAVTQAEVAAQTARMQAAASAKWDQLSAKVSDSYTNDQARKEFDEWWAGNVEPQKAALAAAQDNAALARKKMEEDMRSAALLRAQSAGDAAVNAYEATKNRRVGPGAQAAQEQAASTGSMKGVSLAGAYTPGQDPQKLYDDAVAKALATISPAAAAATGGPMPNYQGVDIASALNRSQYGVPAPAPAAPAAVVAPPAAPVETPPAPLPDEGGLRFRADQNPGVAPAGNALAPAGVAGTVPPGSPMYLGNAAPEDAETWMQRMRRLVAENSQYQPA